MANLTFEDSWEYDVDSYHFEVTFTASALYYCSPGRMYLANGDPGYPPGEELEITGVRIKEIEPYQDGVYVNIDTAKYVEPLTSLIEKDLYDIQASGWMSDEIKQY